MTKPAPRRRGTDGRRLRSERTRLLIINAYLKLLRARAREPTTVQIAARAGCSVRSIYERFANLRDLTFAAADHVVERGPAEAATIDFDSDRQTRVRSYVAIRAQICERWLPLWRVLIVNRADMKELRARVDQVPMATVEHLKLTFRLELLALSNSERQKILIALETLVDFESWGRMREHRGLSVDATRDIWITAIDRMLPPTPPVEE